MVNDPRLSRRSLLQAGLAGASCVALGGSLLVPRDGALAGEAGEYVSLTTGRVLTGMPTTCGLCPAGCGVLAFVEADGRAVGLSGNPAHPLNRGALCAQGSAALNLLNSPYRVRTPLRRAGGRGAGKWEPVSWDLALSDLRDALGKGVKGGEGSGPVAVSVPERRVSPFLQRFVSFFPGGMLEVSDGYELAAERAVHRAVWGADGCGAADLAGAEVVLNFGSDPLGNVRQLLPAARGWSQGSRAGARWITLDPRLSETAVASRRWIPLRPGTDGAFASAVAARILAQGRADSAFLKQLPPGEEARMREALRPWTPERAAAVCGVPAEAVVDAAETFSGARRAAAIYGRGVLARQGGFRDACAVLVLNLITGNVNRQGGYGLYEEESWRQPGAASSGTERPALPGTLFRDLEQGSRSLGTLITWDANPAATDPGGAGTVEVLKSRERVPFHVALSSVWNETCHLADVVLPAATYLAEWGVCRGVCVSDGSRWVGLRQPVFPLEGDARPGEAVLLEAVRRLGASGERAFPFQGVGQFYREVLAANVSASGEGPSVGSLREKGFAVLPGKPVPAADLSCPVVPVGAYAEKRSAAASLHDGGREKGSGPVEASAETAGCERTLILTGSPMQGADALGLAWVEEIAHNRPVWMHPLAARAAGCAEGDRVRVRGPAGEVRTRVRITEGLHPDVVAMSMAGVGMDGAESVPGGKGGKEVWWREDVYGGNVRKVVPWPADPGRICPGWMDTRVVISRWDEDV